MSKKRELLVYFIGALLLFTMPLYIKSQYIITITIFIFIYCILTLGLRIIMKVGEVSFAIAAFMAVGAYSSSLLMIKLQLSFWIAGPMACAVTALLAFGFGSLAIKTKGVHFFIVTLAIGETIRLITLNWNVPLLGGPQGIYGIPAPTPITLGSIMIEFYSKSAMYYVVLVALALALGAARGLDRSFVGRIWDAIGQDDRLVAAIGVNVYRQKLACFTLSSTFAGLAGVVFAHMMTYISPYDFTLFFAMQLLVYVIFGGVGTIAGPLVGATILTIVTELLRNFGRFELIFYGFIIILVLRFIPEGIIGFVRGFLISHRLFITNTER